MTTDSSDISDSVIVLALQGRKTTDGFDDNVTVELALVCDSRSKMEDSADLKDKLLLVVRIGVMTQRRLFIFGLVAVCDLTE